MSLRLILVLIVAALLVSGPTPAQAQRQNALPRFEEADCQFPIPEGAVIECGYLVVPETRGDPTPRIVRLHVAIFRAESGKATADPIVYLEGGPGGSPFLRIESRYNAFKPYMQDRDFILYEQRGTGYSTPSLQCPEMLKLEADALTKPANTLADSLAIPRAMSDCRKRLEAEGIDLAAYNTNASARDLVDLKAVLGIRRWNLYGISYGTRLALVVMRDFPEGIRSVILDSSYPLDRNLYGANFGPANVRGLETLFRGCQAEVACRTAYPNLQRTYTDVLRRLNRTPVTINTKTVTGEPFTLQLTGGAVQSAVIGALYSTALIPTLPKAIYDARDGEYAYLADLVMRDYAKSQTVSIGMYYTVMCADRSLPTLLCNLWGVPIIVSAQPKAVISGIPTLVLAGEYDPVTPPEYGQHTAESLPNSFYYEFPGYGHGVSVSGACAAGLTLEFLANPRQQPEATCLREIGAPTFAQRGS